MEVLWGGHAGRASHLYMTVSNESFKEETD